ncbi:hypothetical protein [Neisseria iguanae]|uniref:hypothetical protein n=1 Tax=Neisseria iguanae TaxID=90242 RepID=UPI001B80A8D1|nr:hypothetical protein [Neisseria iguanae]
MQTAIALEILPHDLPDNAEERISMGCADISENEIREQFPEILNILLIDRTTSTTRKTRNIIWANDNYLEYGETAYAATAQILPELITGDYGKLIMPRALKTAEQQKQRTKTKAEVFTPTHIVKQQNDVLDRDYQNDDIETYVRRKWLEITCGEAPYYGEPLRYGNQQNHTAIRTCRLY